MQSEAKSRKVVVNVGIASASAGELVVVVVGAVKQMTQRLLKYLRLS